MMTLSLLGLVLILLGLVYLRLVKLQQAVTGLVLPDPREIAAHVVVPPAPVPEVIAASLQRLETVAQALVPPPPPPIPADALGARAWTLVREQELIPDRSGESKRHQVYARLIKDFPDVPKRVLSRAIEDALGG